MVNLREPAITSAQLRAARAWLNWSQEQLAAKAGISKRAVVRYEGGGSVSHAETSTSLRTALEAAGLRFSFDGMRGTGLSVVE
ncbi:helix-turn-helix transcriptional regulator [Tardiphaga robiniae]|uniref:Helix-turn-helix transcriptional regulator n=1 Tax=Tardiphaga robiniae TaxID=943830 RepID=A0A7G6TXH4_9BRAD|nr:helix-turn-helix transcriptional regulator [Tardiphaga robiniae]QND71456.1 helix-turn-helix transcriptional regulator [Tardiphaga robiniae]